MPTCCQHWVCDLKYHLTNNTNCWVNNWRLILTVFLKELNHASNMCWNLYQKLVMCTVLWYFDWIFLFYMNLECHCNLTGTVNSSNVCNKITGQCPCKQLLTGRKCDQCQVSLLFHVQIFFFIIRISKLMSTKTVVKI